MARITRVKKARQRYATVPVIDPATGEPKVTPVMRKGEQKTTKKGKPVFMRVTERDLSKPLPNLRCDYPGCDIDGGEIKPGTPYKHITPKSGPYGGRQRSRHEAHPDWRVWDYSNSLSARAARISDDFWSAVADATDPETVTEALSAAAEEVRSDLAEQRRESAQNIEDGFGHPTYQSEELEGQADELDSWADEIEAVDVPELPDPEEVECDYCGGTGKLEETVEGSDDPDEECTECGGEGVVTPEEPTDDQMEDWREEVNEACSIVDEVPV